MTGTNGAKLHALVRELRGEAEDAIRRAEEIERAWSSNDLAELVRLGALTKQEAQHEDAALANACDGCLEPMNPFKRGFVNLKTGEKFHASCAPENLR